MRKFLLLLGVWLCCLSMANAQTRTLSGRITDNSGVPVPFATIQVKGTKTSTVADGDGKFSIKTSGGTVLVISASGTTKKEITVDNSSANLDVSVNRVSENLAEVVVTTALGIKRQSRELGYATTSIRSSQLNQAAVINPATGLAAKVSGVDIRLADNGVNPQVKVTFRGSRSITGSNTALTVVDGIPVDPTYLANLNPNDIDDVTILKGSNAAALYGMSASNGVMAITTKKGKGKFSLTYQNTVSLESVSYFPSLQNEYGGYGGEAGSVPNPATGGTLTFVDPLTGLPRVAPFENEAFGQAFGSKDFPLDSIPIGVTADGKWLFTPFRGVKNGRKDFFQTGVGDQNQLSGSLTNKWGGLYFSGDHSTKQGIVPNDTYARNGGRVNGNVNFGRFSASAGVSYYNISTDIAGNSFNQNRPLYWNVINQLPSTDLKSVKDVNLFQNNQGFVNAYYGNPWWQVANSRARNHTNQLLSNLTLNYKLNDWLGVTARGGYSRSSTNAPSYIDSISFPSFLTAGGGPFGNGNLGLVPGPQGFQTEDIRSHYDDLNSDVFLTATRKVNKFKFNLIAGVNYRARTSYGDWFSNQVNSGPYLGQNVVPSVNTKVTHADGSADAIYQYKRNDQSAYGDLTIGYDNWLFLHGSFRNDWTSILAAGDRSFSYPSVDMSAVLSDVVGVIKNSNVISFLKVRVGYAGTGNVSLDGYQQLGIMGNIGGGSGGNGNPANAGGFSVALPNFGAYVVNPIAAVGGGFPFGNVNGYSQNTGTVQQGLKPEKTQSTEVGFQLGFLKNRINLEVNYYDQIASDQTIPLPASTATGINTFLTNAGKINNSGVEIDLSLTPLIKINKFHFDLSGNFSIQNSKVIEVAGGQAGLDQINFGTVVLGGVYAIPGKTYGQLLVTDFAKDPQGHIIVDGKTGLPTATPNLVDVGNSNYKYFLGLSPTFSYGNFSLRAVFDYRGGAKILNEGQNAMEFAGITAGDAANRQAFIIPGSVIANGNGYTPNTNVPITSFSGLPTAVAWWANTYNQVGASSVVSADFWKMRELSLSYNVPMKFFGAQQVLKGLEVSLIGRNLFMWRPATNRLTDPEFSTNGTGNATGYTTEYQTPPTRIISASIRANIL